MRQSGDNFENEHPRSISSRRQTAVYYWWQSWLHEFVVQFLDAKHSGREHLKVWTNTFAAETWEEQGERIASESVMEKAEDYKTNPLPKQVGVLTASVDVQKDPWNLR